MPARCQEHPQQQKTVAGLQVRRPPLCWPASQSANAGPFSPGFFGLARVFLSAAAGGGGAAASRASRNAFSFAMLSVTAFSAASRSVLPLWALLDARAALLKRASARLRSSCVI